jgi:hypothetical protein
MNQFARMSMTCLALSAALLAGCGGGGDSDDGDDGGPSTQLITTKEQVLAVFNAMGFGPASIAFELTAGTLVENGLPNFVSSASPVVQNCFGPAGNVSGSITFSLTDADNSRSASVGDTLTMQLNACFFDGAAKSGAASFRLTTVNNLAAYFGGTGTGGYSGAFNFGTVPVSGYTVAGDLILTETYEIRGGLRTLLSTMSSPQLVFTGATGTFGVVSIFTDDTSDANVSTTNRYDRTVTANVPNAGNLGFTSSVLEPVRFFENNAAPTGVLLLRNQGVDIRVTVGSSGFSAAVDNGRDGSVEHTFTFTFAELEG